MTTQHTAEALAPKLYAAYIESTGRLSYRGSSVLGLKDASAIDEMDERELWAALRTLKISVAPMDSEHWAEASTRSAVAHLRRELASAIVCPAWEDLSEPVKRAWVASAREALRLTAETALRDINEWLDPDSPTASLFADTARARVDRARMMVLGDDDQFSSSGPDEAEALEAVPRTLEDLGTYYDKQREALARGTGKPSEVFDVKLPGEVRAIRVTEPFDTGEPEHLLPQGNVGHLRHHLEQLGVAGHVLAAEAIVNGQAIAGPGGQPPMSVEFRLVLADNAPDDLRQTIALAIRRSMMFGWVTWGTDCLGEVKLEGWPEARPVYATILETT